LFAVCLDELLYGDSPVLERPENLDLSRLGEFGNDVISSPKFL
jgi:hypothetical protein